MKSLIYAVIPTILLLAACSGKNSDLTGPSKGKVGAAQVQGDPLPTLNDPKVNILFVVDNSNSMKGYQARMGENLESFAKHFFANSRIDYKIGVVPVYDSKYLDDKTVYNSGVRKMNALGELVPLKGATGLYITRDTPNASEVLKQTVMIGVQWGPEAEESFSPVLAIMDKDRNAQKNQNFYDPDAYLAVVFLTDADDVTPGLSGSAFFQKLVEAKGGDRSKVLIAAALPSLRNQSASCTKDGRGPIAAFPALLAASGGSFADLCSSSSAKFGEALASFGKLLTQRVGTQKIALGFTPDYKSLKVHYGVPKGTQEEMKQGAEGYYFDPETNTVVLSPSMSVTRVKGGIVSVEAIPAPL